MIKRHAEMTYHGTYNDPQSYLLQACLDIEESFGFGKGNESF
jgi:hypothetical protein